MYHLVNMDHPYDNPANVHNPQLQSLQQHCELMTVNVNQLITEVEARSVLWDRNNLYYMDRYMKRQAWQEVYKALNPNFDQLPKLHQLLVGNAIERRWRSLRESFSKNVRRDLQIQVPRRAPYIYHQQLNFLKKVIVPTNASASQENEDCPVESRKASILEEKLMQFLETQSQIQRDDHQNFFDSLLPSVRKFDEQKTLTFRTQVLNFIQDIRAVSPEASIEKLNEVASDSTVDEYAGNYQHQHQDQDEHQHQQGADDQVQNYQPSVSNETSYICQGPSSTSDSGIGSPVYSSSLIQTAVCVALSMHQESD